MDTEARDLLRYCRDVETYLCRRNGGHLIRIVGPAFAMVRGWADAGVPLTIVERAIDACCARREARGGAVRPLRIEFCEAEVREQFDRWRRAVGPYISGQWAVGGGQEDTGGQWAVDGGQEGAGGQWAVDSGQEDTAGRRASLSSHLTRCGERLARAAARIEQSEAFRAELDSIIAAVDEVRRDAKGTRGERRSAALDALTPLDARLLDAARAEAGRAGVLDDLRARAEADLAVWRGRMDAAAWRGAVDAATGRLLRDHFDLPDLTL